MEDWYRHAYLEIHKLAKKFPRRLKLKDIAFLKTAKERIERRVGLSETQEKWLLDIHQRMTEPTRIKW